MCVADAYHLVRHVSEAGRGVQIHGGSRVRPQCQLQRVSSHRIRATVCGRHGLFATVFEPAMKRGLWNDKIPTQF
jgi:hypothetical protein